MSDNEPLAYTIRQATNVVGIGRTLLYAEIREGRLRTRKIGRRTLLLRDDLRSWLDATPLARPGAASASADKSESGLPLPPRRGARK